MVGLVDEVVVQDCGVDAALMERDHRRVLVLRPGQTITSAVAAVCAIIPSVGADQARSLVRSALPDNLDVVYDLLPTPSRPEQKAAPVRTPVWVTVALAIIVLALFLHILFACG
jgi:hypothetical protein